MRWWDIHNYLAQNHKDPDLYAFVQQHAPRFIDATTDPFPVDHLISVVEKYHLHDIAMILVPDLELANKYRDLNFVYYPLWIVFSIQQHRRESTTINLIRDHKISCLNRQPRLHRFLAYFELSQMPWFSEAHVSFAGLYSRLGGCGDISDLAQLDELGENVKEFFVQNQDRFPHSSQLDYQWESCHSVNVPAYTNSWANLATETSVQSFFVSEKTTKPLRAGCLFFPVASNGFIDGLSHMGFDLDYEGIDLAFDSDLKWQSRTHRCVREIDRVYEHIIDIWHANQRRIQHNSDLFKSDQLLQYCLQDVKSYV